MAFRGNAGRCGAGRGNGASRATNKSGMTARTTYGALEWARCIVDTIQTTVSAALLRLTIRVRHAVGVVCIALVQPPIFNS